MNLDALNPLKGLENRIDTFNNKLDIIIYSLNPINWVKELGYFLHDNISNGKLDIPFLMVTIASIWLIMLGMDKMKKVLFWSWVGYIILRGVIFA